MTERLVSFMRKASAIFAFAIIALFSVAIIANLSYGLRNVDLTGLVTLDAVDNVQLPQLKGDICTDNDNGRAYIRGETSVLGDVAVDYCLDDTRLVEYSCDSLFRTSKVLICPYGCEDGACK